MYLEIRNHATKHIKNTSENDYLDEFHLGTPFHNGDNEPFQQILWIPF